METESQILQVNIDDIIPNRFQPRIAFDENGLNELAASIKEHGIIQPLVLRKLGKKYEIIAGERRYKASTLAGLTTVPAIISNIDDNKSAEVALVENIQRRDLTAIEEARSYKNLLDKGYLTQEQLAKKMGLSQSTISNKLRLLNLDDTVQQALLESKISERHARALLSIQDKNEQKEWLDKILKERLTVRQLDKLIKDKINNGETPADSKSIQKEKTMEEIKSESKDLFTKEEKNMDQNLNNNQFFNQEIITQMPVNDVQMTNPFAGTDVQTPASTNNITTDASGDVWVQNPFAGTPLVQNEADNQPSSSATNTTVDANGDVWVQNPFAGTDLDINTTQDNQPIKNENNKFFNALEEQPVELNNINPFAQNNTFTIDNVSPANNDIEIFDDISSNMMNNIQQPINTQPTLEPITPFQPTTNTVEELNPNNRFFQPIQEPSIDNIETPIQPQESIINPMDSINNLQQTNLEETQNNMFTTKLNDIKKTLNEMNDKGYNIKLEELELNNSYKIILTIEK